MFAMFCASETSRSLNRRISASGLNREECSRSEEHTSELQSLTNLVCRLLLEKKKIKTWEQTSSSMSNRCELMMLGAPARARLRMESFIRRMPLRSNPVSGSADQVTFGDLRRA